MIFTSFSYDAFISWMEPAFIDLSNSDIENQGLGSVIAHFVGSDPQTTTMIVAAVLGGLLVLWAFLSSDFRDNFDNILGGFVVAAVVVAAWWVTTGELGQTLLEEADMMDERPYAIGAQSFTFAQPSGHLVRWFELGFDKSLLTFALVAGFGVVSGSLLYSVLFTFAQPSGHLVRWFELGFDKSLLTFALVAGFGVVAGSLLYSVLFRKFKITVEWFATWKDFFVHISLKPSPKVKRASWHGGLFNGCGWCFGNGLHNRTSNYRCIDIGNGFFLNFLCNCIW